MSKCITTVAISIVAFIILLPGITEANCLLDPNGAGCNISVYTSYQPMINWPGVTQQGQAGTFASYATAIYSVAIVIAALLAVIRLVIAGVKYMTTDIVSSKGEARNDIIGSLLGLLIIISAVVILQTINPNLTTITIAQPGGSIQGTANSGFITWAPTIQSQACNAQGLQCVTTTCPFLRTQLTCSGWCNSLGGTTNGTLVGNAIGGATGFWQGGAVTCTYAIDPNDPNSTAQAQLIASTIDVLNRAQLPSGVTIDITTDRAQFCNNGSLTNWWGGSGSCSGQAAACTSGQTLPGGAAGTPQTVTITPTNVNTVTPLTVVICRP